MPVLTLPDGRALDVTVTGPDEGPVLVFHHGTPGCGVPLTSLVRTAAARGLRLVMKEFDGYLPLQASAEPSAVRSADVILFCVKSGDTEAAGASIAHNDLTALLYLQGYCDSEIVKT